MLAPVETEAGQEIASERTLSRGPRRRKNTRIGLWSHFLAYLNGRFRPPSSTLTYVTFVPKIAGAYEFLRSKTSTL